MLSQGRLRNQHMALEGCFTIPKKSLMVVLFDTIAKVVGIGHVHQRLHVTFVCGFHVPLEGLTASCSTPLP